jgi:hypothetical protein
MPAKVGHGRLADEEGSVRLILLVPTILNELLLFTLKISFSFVTKQATFMRRSTVLSLSFRKTSLIRQAWKGRQVQML